MLSGWVCTQCGWVSITSTASAHTRTRWHSAVRWWHAPSSIRVGFSAVQTAFHHPVRLAEQIALLDNLSGGRITVGTARGSAFNRYEYRGYGVKYAEAQERLLEAEQLLVKVWSGERYHHKGKHWNVEIPVLRPKVVQKPHPPLVRAIASEGSLVQMARQGRPFMLAMSRMDRIRYNVRPIPQHDGGRRLCRQ